MVRKIRGVLSFIVCALLVGCGLPSSLQTGDADLSVVGRMKHVDSGESGKKSISLVISVRDARYQDQAKIHRWVSPDIFSYEVILKKLGLVLAKVEVRPNDAQGKVCFSHLKPSVNYSVEVIARGDIGGFNATYVLNQQIPAIEDICFDGVNDIEESITKQMTVQLDSAPFDGNAGAIILASDGNLIGGNLSELGVPLQDTTLISVSNYSGSGISGYLNGNKDQAEYSSPSGLAINSKGEILVADQGNHCIRRIALGGVVYTVAGNGQRGYQDGQGTLALFDSPASLVVDAKDNLYVCDSGNNCIRKIDVYGFVTTIAGGANAGFIDAKGTQALFYSPTGIAIAQDSSLYISDTYNHAIRRIDKDGTVTTLAGNGTPGYIDGIHGVSKFYCPTGIAISSNGALVIADTENHSLRTLTNDGNVSTLAGNGLFGDDDGKGTSARFDEPTGVAIDDNGTVYVTDTSNNTIRKIMSGGCVSTYAGSGYIGDEVGLAEVVKFNAPAGISINPTDHMIYVADMGNSRIKRVVR